MIDRLFIFELILYSQMKIEDEFDILKGFNQAASSIFYGFALRERQIVQKEFLLTDRLQQMERRE